jgi:hypothetical protein
MSEQLKPIQNALENGSITEKQIEILMELHDLNAYEQLLELLQNHVIGIITRKDEQAFELLSSHPSRHQLHDVFQVLTKLVIVST